MKDLYTFDYDVESALKSYEEVREAYRRIFLDELKLPILVAQASSGDMGGDLSHEYHIPTDLGEDHVMSCNKCDYVANEEVAEKRPAPVATKVPERERRYSVWRGISICRKKIVNVWIHTSSNGTPGTTISEASREAINLYAVKKAFPDLDSSIERPANFWSTDGKTASSDFYVVNLFDASISEEGRKRILATDRVVPNKTSLKSMSSIVSGTHNFTRVVAGNSCPRCSAGSLKVTKVMELGHTFHLGTRYSIPLKTAIVDPAVTAPAAPAGKADGEKDKDFRIHTRSNVTGGTSTVALVPAVKSGKRDRIALQMGCHGIGISRLMGAIANHVNHKDGLNWPRAIAPYEVVVCLDRLDAKTYQEDVYDCLAREGVDVVLDDQQSGNLSAKFFAFDLIGIPIWVVLKNKSAQDGLLEIRCPRLKFSSVTHRDQLPSVVNMLISQL